MFFFFSSTEMLGSLRWAAILVIVACTISVKSNYPPPERLTGMNPCISKQTCHDCIQTPHCAWCAAPVSFHNFHTFLHFIKFFLIIATFLTSIEIP